MTTRVPLGATAEGKGGLIPTANQAAAALNEVKPVRGNLWL
ncbi:hypothetical protein AB0D57_41070 [Streptomyces sp. NPDC048275]